jgi:hypothetical protein
MDLFNRVRSLLSLNNEDARKDGVGISGPFDENFPEPDNKSTLGDDEWRWDRVDEQPYDHYTEAMEEVKELKREKRHDDVEELLLWCIDFVEAEAAFQHRQDYGYEAIAPAYYRHLAIVYRKEDRYQDEVKILRRYVDACEEVGNLPQDGMKDRLDRARELAAE